MTHFLALEPAIVARLEEAMPEGVQVLTAVDMQSTIAPSVQVIYDGYAVGQRTGAVVALRQQWLTVVTVRNTKTVRAGVGMRDEAGPLIDQVIEAMHRLRVEGYMPLTLENAPPPLYAGGFAYFPLAWSTTLNLRHGANYMGHSRNP